MLLYLKKNTIPILIEFLFIILCLILPPKNFIYINFLFYLSLFLYFIITKEFSIKEWLINLKKGKEFWKQVAITIIFFILAFVLTIFLENTFFTLDTGTIVLQRDNWFKLLLFSISTIIFPAITEETFYRKNIISFKNKPVLLMSSILSMLLYAVEHALLPWGIFLTMIWALPLTISYIKTKNIYVPMTAHFIGNLLGNGIDVITTIISLI